MLSNDKRYFITDMQGNFYGLDDKNNLVVVLDSSHATLFTIREANERIGSGKKSRFYNVLESDIPETVEEDSVVNEEPTYEVPELDAFETPTMFDGLHNDWESKLYGLCYMSDHISEYQQNLKQMLSDVDKEICDIMHYLEFGDLDDERMLMASKMLRERRQHRREIKDEMERTAVMKATFLDGSFGVKVQQSLDLMERMNKRQYTPRKLTELFENQLVSA